MKYGDVWEANGTLRAGMGLTVLYVWDDFKGCLNQVRFNVGDPLEAYDRDPYLDTWFDTHYNPRWSVDTFYEKLVDAESLRT